MFSSIRPFITTRGFIDAINNKVKLTVWRLRIKFDNCDWFLPLDWDVASWVRLTFWEVAIVTSLGRIRKENWSQVCLKILICSLSRSISCFRDDTVQCKHEQTVATTTCMVPLYSNDTTESRSGLLINEKGRRNFFTGNQRYKPTIEHFTRVIV